VSDILELIKYTKDVERMMGDYEQTIAECERLRLENEALREALEELLYARTDKAERMAHEALRSEGE
jgi:regulator of replication initiation timing